MAKTLRPDETANPRSTELSFSSSLADLADGFEWASRRALAWVQTGRSGAMPSYWAGLTDRPMFGYAIGYGLESIIGPLEVKYSWSPEVGHGYTWFSVGFWF